MDDKVGLVDYYELEKWSEVTGMQFNKGKKSKVLHLGTSKHLHNYRMRHNSSSEKRMHGL